MAVGEPGRLIRFTINDSSGFSLDSSHAFCWNGIRFENTPSTNDASILEYCRIEYSKATDDGSPYGGLYDLCGGAVSIITSRR